jgi:hypothetical protein
MAMTAEPVQPLDAAPVTVAETEVERLQRFLEVSQTMLEAVKWEMQVTRDHEVAVDRQVAGEFSVHYSNLMGCIYFLHSLCLC